MRGTELFAELAAMLGFNAYVLAFGTSLFTEIPFTALLLACLLLGERRWAYAAGVVGGVRLFDEDRGVAVGVVISLCITGWPDNGERPFVSWRAFCQPLWVGWRGAIFTGQLRSI